MSYLHHSLKEEERKQVFVIPHAGGSVFSLQNIRIHLSRKYDLHFLELPGRGRRIKEAFLDHLKDAVSDYIGQIQQLRNKMPYVIYGHSLGALLGLYVTKELECVDDPPKKLIVSGSAGPNIRSEENIHMLDNFELKKKLEEYGGIDKSDLDNFDFFNFIEPIVRSDFKLFEQDTHPKVKIKTDIEALMGSDEEFSSKVNNWNTISRGKINTYIMKGNHFFIFDHFSFIGDRVIKF
ncbi:thioesterase II family protein [Flammeovirga aprica]|uniref:Thioesterase n=1 Tax=Flammeovirga aprica JL-4 TaxID=694437 RepID=A0A7X9XAL4_9BACT|nr:thioesterase [Flammeovirga aprica]NME69791.1 thioesterase [Flammeovirga aprica JL-4]